MKERKGGEEAWQQEDSAPFTGCHASRHIDTYGESEASVWLSTVPCTVPLGDTSWCRAQMSCWAQWLKWESDSRTSPCVWSGPWWKGGGQFGTAPWGPKCTLRKCSQARFFSGTFQLPGTKFWVDHPFVTNQNSNWPPRSLAGTAF